MIMKNLERINVKEISKDQAVEVNGGGFWLDLLNYLLDRDPDYQAFKEHTGQQ